MHLPSFLVVATTAASTLVSARVDRFPSAHRQFARSEAARHLERREALPEPEPYRLFAKPESADAALPFAKRDEPSFVRIGDAVNEVATALKLEMPPVVQLAAVHPSGAKTREHKNKVHKKNKVCRKKTPEEKRKSRKAHDHKKAQETVKAKAASHSSHNQELAVAVKPKTDKSTSSDKTESVSTNTVAGILKPVRSLLGFSAPNCGASGATDEFPNGAESWLNCGISKSNPGSKWQPPKGVTLDHITTVSLEHALATNPVWEPCKPFIPLFERIAKEENLPAILLASFALQESTCNPHVLGDNAGAFGLMQITQDKCGGRDATGCADPEYNVKTAAAYFNTELSNRGGEFLEALGAYNGWYPGLSYAAATAAASSDCCVCQQNMDYLHQMTNGWLMGRTGYDLGSYKNLAVCHD
ncbi:uncharacterized protein JCM15063_001416 [Sporobolomyces koalae]|uniref:uncharacterized protein n=1 Tax=Sporobolomyces koalae TaxID=500713 RepID=UPI00317340C0